MAGHDERDEMKKRVGVGTVSMYVLLYVAYLLPKVSEVSRSTNKCLDLLRVRLLRKFQLRHVLGTLTSSHCVFRTTTTVGSLSRE